MNKLTSILAVFLLFCFTGCKNEAEFPRENNERTLTIFASMPADEQETRAGLSEIEGSLNISVKWKLTDKIKLFFAQTGNPKEQETAIFNISADGKKCSFTASIPAEIDLRLPFSIYGFSDMPGLGVSVRNGVIQGDMMPVESLDAGSMPVPVWFNTTVNDVQQPISVNFVHVGAYEVIHVKNDSQQKVNLPKCRVVPQGNFGKWYREKEVAGSTIYYPFFDFQNNRETVFNDITDYPSANTPAYSIEAGQTKTIFTWIKPAGNAIPNWQLQVGDKLSDNSIASKYPVISAGQAYHVYALWNGQRAVVTDENFNNTSPSIKITTSKAVGESVFITIKPLYFSGTPVVWIDLNNNGTKDAGEEVTQFGQEVSFPLKSQTFTIYGDVNSLYCGGQKITDIKFNRQETGIRELLVQGNELASLDLSSLTFLETLYCSGNNLTSLNLTNNTLLKDVSCDGNKLTSLDLSRNTALNLLSIGNNNLSAIDLSPLKNLSNFSCRYNETLTSLDFSRNTKLDQLYCTGATALTQVNLSNCKELRYVYFGSVKKLKKLDLSGLPQLLWVDCLWSDIEEIDCSETHALEKLDCREMEFLTQLTVSSNSLPEIKVSSTQLTSLDLSKCKNLKKVDCANNAKLVSLNISNTSVYYLGARWNAIETLTVTNAPLYGLDIASNKLNTEALDKLFTDLPDVTNVANPGGVFNGKSIQIFGNPGYETCNKQIAIDKGWKL